MWRIKSIERKCYVDIQLVVKKSLLHFESRTDRKKLCIITFVFIAGLSTLYVICCLGLWEN